MGPKTSKAEHPTLVETKTVTIPRIPQDIIDEILDHLVTISGTHHLQACALVSKSWVPSCRRRLFHTVLFTWLDARRWLRTFPVPEESPAHHVRDLCIRIGGPADWDPDAFLGFIPWFTNVRRMTLVRYGGRYCGNLQLEMPLLRKLPRSVTSLTINAGGITLAEIRNIIALLPNMDDLFLSGALVSVNELERIVMTLRGGFAGKFGLRVACYAGRDTMDMLFEILIGLHFTEVEILCARECLPSAVKLVEACGKTLVKLSHEATTHRKYPGFEILEQSFNFSSLQNLREVNFGITVNWSEEALPWIHMALSTLRSATSPHLSTIRLDFGHSYIPDRSIEPMTQDMGNDLRRIADEVTRIESEFDGAVDLTVVSDPGFAVVLDTLNILQPYRH